MVMRTRCPNFNPETVLRIRKYAEALPGETRTDIAHVFNCSPSTISRALNRDLFDEYGYPKTVDGSIPYSKNDPMMPKDDKQELDNTILEDLYEVVKANNALLYEIADMLRWSLVHPGTTKTESKSIVIDGHLKNARIK